MPRVDAALSLRRQEYFYVDRQRYALVSKKNQANAGASVTNTLGSACRGLHCIAVGSEGTPVQWEPRN